MRLLRSLGQSALVYIILSALMCGGPLMPIALLTIYRDSLGAPFWGYLVVVGAIYAALGSFVAGRRFTTQRYFLPMFVALWMVLSAGLVGGYATYLRAQVVAESRPDNYAGNWFLSSLQNAPSEFQFFLHAAAMKDCKPYAWSYRQMTFYELPPNITVNLNAFPREWLDRCSIR